ncbi:MULTISPECIES: hypothetical protein [Mycobacteriaceae]|uniref:Uncharacterized protein n=1 Tax=Mycolicibacterium parafortuitum TaxID=39692 RepID=A0ACC6MC30_MYCPF|nr:MULTISPECIES: hypothetical protein [Mycobacteriaceae]MDZ5084511.1 hypothetical protein [Mycolicibacterium parafortuitum]
MTNPEQNVTSDQTAEEDQVLAPATPGAEALPLPDNEVDKPTDQ